MADNDSVVYVGPVPTYIGPTVDAFQVIKNGDVVFRITSDGLLATTSTTIPTTQVLVDLGTIEATDLLANGPTVLYTPASPIVAMLTFLASEVEDLDGFMSVQIGLHALPLPATYTGNLRLTSSGGTVVSNSFGAIADTPIVAALCGFAGAPILGVPDAWQANHAYAARSQVLGSDGHYWSTVAGGTSGGSAPDWAGNEFGSVTDNDITWDDQAAPPESGSIHVYALVSQIAS